MNFLCDLGNHNELGRRSLEDPCAILTAQLRYLGHTVARMDGKALIDGTGITVLFEGWRHTADAQILADAKKRGARFLIIATEQPTPKGFNWGLDQQFIERQQAFPEIAKEADAIWCLVPGAAKWYGQFGTPAVDVELGYSPFLVRRGLNPPDSEFCFFGNITPRRKKLMDRLTKRVSSDMRRHGHYSKFTAFVATYFGEGGQRDVIVVRGKVLPLMRAFEPMGLVSSSRISTTLHLGRPVIAEPHELDQNWRGIIEFAPSGEDFLRRAVEARHEWRTLHAKQMAAFKEVMSPEQQVGKALQATGLLGRVPRSVAA